MQQIYGHRDAQCFKWHNPRAVCNPQQNEAGY